MTYLAAQKKMQTAWKLQTKTLPRLAKTPGLYCSRLFPSASPWNSRRTTSSMRSATTPSPPSTASASSGMGPPSQGSRRIISAPPRSFA